MTENFLLGGWYGFFLSNAVQRSLCPLGINGASYWHIVVLERKIAFNSCPKFDSAKEHFRSQKYKNDLKLRKLKHSL